MTYLVSGFTISGTTVPSALDRVERRGDYNPVHYDAEVAAASPFGEIIVQGGITSSILNAIVAQELPGPGTVFLQLDHDLVPWLF